MWPPYAPASWHCHHGAGEGRRLGGTCLNIGCIPSKALIHAADGSKPRHRAAGSQLGIRVADPQIDIAQTVRWKDGIVTRLTGGVGAFCAKAGVQVLKGWAQIEDGKTAIVQVDLAKADAACAASICCWPPAPEPVELPSMPFWQPWWPDLVIVHGRALPDHPAVNAWSSSARGYIGLELGMAYRKLGVDVTVVEAAQRCCQLRRELTNPCWTRCKKRHRAAPGLQRAGLGCRTLGVHVRSDERADEFALPPSACWSPSAAGHAPQALASIAAADHGRAPCGHRRALPHLDAQCLGDWRCDRRAHAGAPRHGPGRMRGRANRRQNRSFAPAAIPAVCFTDPGWWSPASTLPAGARASVHRCRLPRSPPTAGP